MKYSLSTLTISLLRITCCCLFLGRAWQHLFWDAPFRTLLWDESLIKPIVEGFSSYTWQEYANSLAVDTNIQYAIRGFGFLYLLCALASLFVSNQKRVWNYILRIGAIGLLFLAVLYFKEKFFQIGQLLEYTAQIASPVLLLWWMEKKPINKSLFLNITKVCIAITFAAHGLYAVGFYPVPGNFIDMLIASFGVTEDAARLILLVVGILDFVLAILIFIPRLARYALLYAFVWGGLTAFARVYANFYSDFALTSLHQWFWEFLYRVPHASLPLLALWVMRKQTVKNTEVEAEDASLVSV